MCVHQICQSQTDSEQRLAMFWFGFWFVVRKERAIEMESGMKAELQR